MNWISVVESAHLPTRRAIAPPPGWRGYLIPRWLRFRYERFLERIGAERLWQHTPTAEPERVYVVPGLGVVASPETAARLRVLGADYGSEPSYSRWVVHSVTPSIPAFEPFPGPPPIDAWSTMRARMCLGVVPRDQRFVLRGNIS